MSTNVFLKKLGGVIALLAGIALIAFTTVVALKVIGFILIAGGVIAIVFVRE